MGYKLKGVYMRPNGTEQRIRPNKIDYTITGSTTVGSYTPGSFSDLQGCFISPDGSNMYISFWNNRDGKMAQYSLSTPRDVSTASSVRDVSVTKPNGFCFNSTGTYMFLSTENGNVIQRFSLSTAWDISTMTLDSGQTLAATSSFSLNVSISDNGDYIFFGDNGNGSILQYELATPFDLTTATNQKVMSVSSNNEVIVVRDSGKIIYTGASQGQYNIKQYELDTAYDISSNKTQIGESSASYGEGRCLYVSPDMKYWTIGVGSSIYQYEAQPIS